MSVVVWANNANGTLAASITSTQTTIAVNSGQGSLYPALSAGQFFPLTLISASNATTYEIVYCTGRSGDTLTVERAQENTAGKSFNQNDLVNLQPTAGTLAQYGQLGATNTWAQPQTLSEGAILPNNVTIRGLDADSTSHALIGVTPGGTPSVLIDSGGIGASCGGTFTMNTPGTTGNEAVAISQFGVNGGATQTNGGGSITATAAFTAASAGIIFITGNTGTGGGSITSITGAFTNATSTGFGGANFIAGTVGSAGLGVISDALTTPGGPVTISFTANISGGSFSNLNFVYVFIPSP